MVNQGKMLNKFVKNDTFSMQKFTEGPNGVTYWLHNWQSSRGSTIK